MTEWIESAPRDDGDLLGTDGFGNAEDKREHEGDMRQLGGLHSSALPQFRSGLAVPALAAVFGPSAQRALTPCSL